MDAFDSLLQLADTLLGPNGCPWDREQTFETLQPYVLEEMHELLEALDLKDKEKIKEELGDCFYTLIFVAKLAEKHKIFTLQNCLTLVKEKLVRRHPHVFGDVDASSKEEIMQNWEEVKKQEGKTNPIGGIPPTLPSLARAQKVISKLKRAKKKETAFQKNGRTEEEILGEKLWDLVAQAESAGIDAESALRRTCLMYEQRNT